MSVKKIVSLFLVLMMLCSLVTPVMAKKAENENENCNEITLRRIVEVEIARNEKAILNVTEVNKSLSEWIAEKFNASSCQDQSCLAFDYQVEMKEIYNYSINGKQLTLSEVKVYNESSSFEFRVLSYFAETATYNLSLVTRIMQVEGENYFVTAINVAPKDQKKFAPFADVVEVKSEAKLSEHYRILAEVLNEIRKQDETSWVWNKAKLELSYLSRAVERNLAEFNVEGKGTAIAIDDLCTDACSLVCSMSGATACFIICNLASISGCSWICSALWGAACAYTCSYYCTGNPSICATGCGGVCSGICSNQCGRLGPLAYFCEKYACAPACTLVCGPILATFCKT